MKKETSNENIGETVSVESMIEQINQAEPDITWYKVKENKEYDVVIKLPFGCLISAQLYVDDRERNHISIAMFQINEQLRSQERGGSKGVGTRLLKILMDEAKKYEVVDIYGNVTSKAALATRAKVFGSKNLKFYNHITKQEVDKTFDQIMEEKNESVNPLGEPFYNIDYDVLSKIEY